MGRGGSGDVREALGGQTPFHEIEAAKLYRGE